MPDLLPDLLPELPPDLLVEKMRHALALHRQGQLGQAQGIYRQVLESEPRHFDATYLLGIVAGQSGQPQAAVDLFDRAIAVNARHAAVHADRGTMLRRLGRLQDALASFDRALEIEPDFPEALNSRGIALQNLGRQEEALASYGRALAIQPDHVEARYNRGVALQQLGRHADVLAVFAENLASYARTLALQPDAAAVWYSQGITLQNLGRHVEALASFDRAIASQPGYVAAHWHRSLTRLLLGDFQRGWEDYEWRLQLPALQQQVRAFRQPRWRGEEPLAGKTIFIHAEQGLGDTLQFCRYARLLAGRGARVVLEVQPILKSLLADLEGVSSLVAIGEELPEFDFHCPLLSLPLAFRTDLGSIPAAPRYLAVDEARRALWRERLGARRGTRVGLVWAGNPRVEHDSTRSIPLRALLGLAQPGVELIGLQKELRAGDRELLAAHAEIRHLGDELTDFADTAAVIANLDLVISVDTVVAHLAGALGHPVWILQAFTPDFRWLLHRDDSPWYPSARLFRQTRFADWGSVTAAVQQALGRV